MYDQRDISLINYTLCWYLHFLNIDINYVNHFCLPTWWIDIAMLAMILADISSIEWTEWGTVVPVNFSNQKLNSNYKLNMCYLL